MTDKTVTDSDDTRGVVSGPKLLVHPKQWHWPWILWEVTFPIALPTLVTFLIGIVMLSAPSNMQTAIKVIYDFSPVTICFFSVTLLSTGLNRMWVKNQQKTGLFSALLGLFIISGFFSGIFTFFRQIKPDEGPNFYAYLIAIVIFFSTIRICHVASHD
jgi:hypothetical protein